MFKCPSDTCSKNVISGIGGPGLGMNYGGRSNYLGENIVSRIKCAASPNICLIPCVFAWIPVPHRPFGSPVNRRVSFLLIWSLLSGCLWNDVNRRWVLSGSGGRRGIWEVDQSFVEQGQHDGQDRCSDGDCFQTTESGQDTECSRDSCGADHRGAYLEADGVAGDLSAQTPG